MAFGCCCVLFGMVILVEGSSAKVYSYHCPLFSHFLDLIIYAYMGHKLTIIDVWYAYISLNLLALYTIACCIRSDM